MGLLSLNLFKLSHLVVTTIILICHANGSTLDDRLRAQISTGSHHLAGSFASQLISNNPHQSFVVSSVSALLPLAQLALFSGGRAQKQLLDVLHFNNIQEITVAFPKLVAQLNRPRNVTLQIANKFYANKGNPLSQNFITASRRYFDADGQNIDFSQNILAAYIINDWVSSKTDGKIRDIVNPKMFDANTRLCLADVIHIVADWLQPFNKRETYNSKFTKSNGNVVRVPMMAQRGNFNYFSNEKFQALDMLYVGGDLSFLTILPKNTRDLKEILERLNDPIYFGKVISSLKPTEVQINLPKFQMKTRIDLKDLLIKDGVTAVFHPNMGLEGILENRGPVSVSDAIQVAYIIVDELHTEAGASTVITGLGATQYQVPFIADRPFIFFILDHINKIVLMNGIFDGPQ